MMKLLDIQRTRAPTPGAVAAAVVNTAQLVLRLVRAAVRRQHPVNLSVTQLRALDYVSANPGTSLSAVADYVGLALPSASVLVDGLARRAPVAPLGASGDRRPLQLPGAPAGRAPPPQGPPPGPPGRRWPAPGPDAPRAAARRP